MPYSTEIFLWVQHKHAYRVGGERSGMKAQNDRMKDVIGATQNLEEQPKLKHDAEDRRGIRGNDIYCKNWMVKM